MALYEHMFLARQDIAPQQVDELLNIYKGVIETYGGKVGRVENWGLRPLAYRIRKNRKAYYVLVNIDAPATAIAEVERQMRINEDILRYMTIRVEKHEKEKSAMFSRLDRNGHIGHDEKHPRSPSRQREDVIEGVE
ncbi:30S ribosomal protein S6 [Bartonella henselae]|uniref:Small ribosomal subunit protein bS6 n=2 Tax=Bartonella henselae TaxID=38323 RepID=RS6_BARHE|nr:30S ribosomal protein S6 [Bartonella henselae]Q6G446.1 RecName: Full=Small ribosomal subunit protein bS6; AltName: Full=30S ribosomal protein S6 [Bartonella henselae str. Houston-1]ATP12138.1 30S ribosomal protein S6 [Bartonella henselae]ETS07926.1 30S ribosomal protein S6 [Bartonella henselae JK 42]ETS09908.1 30S ribosomal protein S6 [Bartonella henselae JK 50]ETS10418.1 30S ribosomal protein S6 [Bartonella henselae JK 51]ETS12342.1 30S ribosomal protein S6 [Bartonella henselae JK 41]